MRYALIVVMLLLSPAKAGDFTADELLTRWREAADQCRGGHGDEQETWEACGARDVYAELLTRREICGPNDKGWECPA